MPQHDSPPAFTGREGDFLELRDGSIFEVKGLVHPPDRLVAYPRYIPDEAGDRRRGPLRYRKVYPLEERYRLLRQRYPHLLVLDPVLNIKVPQVSQSEIAVHHRPEKTPTRLREKTHPDETERHATDFLHLLQDRSGLPPSALGISGSIMIGLHTPSSDIDVIVYGRSEARRVREALKLLLNQGGLVRPYGADELRRLHRFRVTDTAMPFSDFARHEARKTFQGVFNGREFFVRYLPGRLKIGEEYGRVRYYPAGSVKVKARVADASESFYTPCRYRLERVKVLEGLRGRDIVEAVSFRGRFCEQVETGESVMLRGKLERVVTPERSYHRVLLGGSPSDVMLSL